MKLRSLQRETQRLRVRPAVRAVDHSYAFFLFVAHLAPKLKQAPSTMNSKDPTALLAQASTLLRPEQRPAEQWKALCKFLSQLKVKEQAPLIRPLHAKLRALPDAVRTVDPDWIFRQRQGQRVPALTLARAFVWSNPRLDDNALQEILGFPDLPPLTSMKLFGQSLSSLSAIAIAQSSKLANLHSLNLTSNQIDGQGLRALLQTPALPELRRLFLGRNQLTDDDVQWLMQSTLQAPLERLCLRDNPISPQVQASLAQHFASTSIELTLVSEPNTPVLPRRKRGRSNKKKPSQ